MSMDLLARADGLRTARVPFVLATVVRTERPASSQPGDRALVLADGTVEGFVGGACVDTTLRTQSAQLLAAGGGATLLRISPGPDTGTAPPGTVLVDNPCLSGGTLELFLEAIVPARLVHVFGDSPIGRALVAVGAAAGYDTEAVTDPAVAIPADATAVVVASHGHDELPVLRAALAAKVPYVALVASPKRGAAVLAELGEQPVKTPAGLDIGARTPGEVAVSILAELISRHPATTTATAAPQTATDPVCGMTVTVGPTSLTHVHAGRTWYFCAPGCATTFAADPARFLA